MILTLLDYIDPPGLANGSFKLPVLRDKNIFEADFFAPETEWTRYATKTKFDWIVGNPPWIEVKGGKITQEDRHVWDWMQSNKQGCPTGGHQVAEAFAWKVASHIAVKGVVGLLLPAMTLFKDESKAFRTKFFQQNRVSCVANFANLRHVLFGEQSLAPAAAFFYSPRIPASSDEVDLSEERILTYAPFRANQEANRPSAAEKQKKTGKRKRTWNIVVNANEVRELRAAAVASGDLLPWKLAMWGSHRDERLLRRVRNRFPTSLSQFADDNDLDVHEGPQLRSQREAGQETLEPVKGLAGKNRLKIKKLQRCGRIFEFPPGSLKGIEPSSAYLRLRGGRQGLVVSYPPHIIVDASRRFAVYSDEFIAVPPRYIGISGSEDKAQLLRALSLYLSSDFVKYHQFLTSPEWGIRAARTALNALLRLPVPLDALGNHDLQGWVDLHASLVKASSDQQASKKTLPLLDGPNVSGKLSCLTAKMNEEVNDLLGLTDSERTLVNDFVSLRFQMTDGKVNQEVVRKPTEEEMKEYLFTLRSELDAFLEDQPGLRHELVAVQDERSAMISIDLKTGKRKSILPQVLAAEAPTAKEFAEIRKELLKERSQWVYFDRSLRIYEGSRTYLFKPLQRMLWTKSQALLDSDEIIAETLLGEED
ncbi:MAG: N-6 DNA methylase [Planctomycetes bacterium]|nr:N-6 DNA methylase [Planctomycetota bacterium]